MVSVSESELFGNAINMLEALNSMLYTRNLYEKTQKIYRIHDKIELVIEFLDSLVV